MAEELRQDKQGRRFKLQLKIRYCVTEIIKNEMKTSENNFNETISSTLAATKKGNDSTFHSTQWYKNWNAGCQDVSQIAETDTAENELHCQLPRGGWPQARPPYRATRLSPLHSPTGRLGCNWCDRLRRPYFGKTFVSAVHHCRRSGDAEPHETRAKRSAQNDVRKQ